MKKFKVGLQLYSIRKAMSEDMDKALKAVKDAGYDYVEFAGYFGKTAKEVKALLEKYELEAASVHQAPDLFFEEGQSAIDFLKEIGVKYSAIPWYKIEEYLENWDNTVEKFTKLGKMLKDNGIKLLYHNHDFEFTVKDGEIILDKLYETIPTDLLAPEFDTCWIHYAKHNPAQYLTKYSGRIDVVHLKDFVCDSLGGAPVYGLIGADGTEAPKSKAENGFKFKPVGEGRQDFEAILTACEKGGTEYVIVEQDESYDEDPIECARRSRAYLKEKFGL